jgi:hypothetical protein
MTALGAVLPPQPDCRLALMHGKSHSIFHCPVWFAFLFYFLTLVLLLSRCSGISQYARNLAKAVTIGLIFCLPACSSRFTTKSKEFFENYISDIHVKTEHLYYIIPADISATFVFWKLL